MDIFDSTLRAEIAQIHKNIFDTYARTIRFRFYMTAKEIVVEDPNFLYEFDSTDSNTNEIAADYADFPACVIYLKRQEFSDFIKGEDTSIRFKANYQRIRVQVEENAFEYLKDAERYNFGGQYYAIEQGWRRLGPLAEFPIYEILLQSIV